MDKTTLRKRGNYYDVVIPMIKPKLQEAINNHQFKYVKNGLKGKKSVIIEMSTTAFVVEYRKTL